MHFAVSMTYSVILSQYVLMKANLNKANESGSRKLDVNDRECQWLRESYSKERACFWSPIVVQLSFN